MDYSVLDLARQSILDKVEENAFENGEIKKTMDIARNMKSRGLDVELISECTALSLDEVHNL